MIKMKREAVWGKPESQSTSRVMHAGENERALEFLWPAILFLEQQNEAHLAP